MHSSILEKPKALRSSSSSSACTLVPAVTWEDYAQLLLMESGHVSRASIHSLQDGRQLASTKDFFVNREQVETLQRGFHDCSQLQKEGLVLHQHHYSLTRVTDGRVMVGRDVKTGAGCVIYRANTCLIVTCYDEGIHPGSCYSLVTHLGDFLVENGF